MDDVKTDRGNLIAVPSKLGASAVATGTHPLDLDVIKALAMEVGKSAVAYVEVMYPEAIAATSSTFKLSLRNEIYNTIMYITELHDEQSAREALAQRERHRRAWVGAYRKMRRAKVAIRTEVASSKAE